MIFPIIIITQVRIHDRSINSNGLQWISYSGAAGDLRLTSHFDKGLRDMFTPYARK